MFKNKKEFEEWLEHLELEEKFKNLERHGIKLIHELKEKLTTKEEKDGGTTD